MIEVAHWSALAPLAFMAVFRRGAGVGYWLCALAFLTSFAADTLAWIYGGTWAFVPYYRVAQYGLFGAALLTPDARALLPALAMYAGLGTLLYFGMEPHRNDPEPYTVFMRWWYPYQSVRLASFGLFGWAAWRRA